MEINIINTKCLIIGSGPSGYTAAIYASRAGMSPLLYSGSQIGGQLVTTTDVENFPGYPDGIMGPNMMEDFRKQAERFGTILKYDTIEKVEFSENEKSPHKAYSSNGDQIEAETIIISTGASAKYLGLDAEKKFLGSGVSACATCDGFFYKEKDVIVVGAGDTASEEAVYLSKLCKKVTLVVRRDEMKASKAMQERVNKTQNIEILWNTELVDIMGESVVDKVKLIQNQTNKTTEIPIDGVFIAIGHKPNTDIFRGAIKLDVQGYIITEAKSTLTNIKGVFAAGDCQDNHYRQAITAAGSGCMAALDAESYLSNKS